MSKVVPFIARPVFVPRPDVIKEAEALLAMARSGEVVGMAVTTQHADETVEHVLVGEITMRLIGGLQMVTHRACVLMDED